MTDQIETLLESIRRGSYEDPAEKISLLAAALNEAGADGAFLGPLLKAPQIPIRLAALEAVRMEPRQDLDDALRRLTDDPESRVRQKLLECLEHLAAETARDVLRVLLADSEEQVRVQAAKLAGDRQEFAAELVDLLESDSEWEVRQAAAAALGRFRPPSAPEALLAAIADDDDWDVSQECVKQLDRQLEQPSPETIARLMMVDLEVVFRADGKMGRGRGRGEHVRCWMKERTGTAVDPKALAEFGADLTALAENGTLPRAYEIERRTAALVGLYRRDKPRSVVLIGKSGAGKSSLVNELVYELAKPENGGWRVVRVSPSDIMAGTRYIGEWETKVKELVETVRQPRRALVYVPNLEDLATSGRHSKSDSNVLSCLAPHLDDGSVVLLGECGPEAFERGVAQEPAFARLFDKVLVEELSVGDAEAVLRRIRAEAGISISDERLAEIMELSGYFFGHLARPGSAATLMRAVIAYGQKVGGEVTRLDLLKVLSQSTGVPVKLLDDASPLDQRTLRAFFQERIAGQDEAVDAVVDVVTLIKAGLTDPNRPFNVLLFVGPTGVGKTELARTLAEYIFGDPARLVRLDMSEFAGGDGFVRLIGGRGENGLLTDAVRQRPFSVVLLDELEKSHPNVFDLCLQIFDAGRLTDGLGRTVDFRRTVVILTSNVGAERGAQPLGFGAADGEPAGPTSDPDRTFRELSQFFRPEFLNRIDRIVHFRPLSLDVAEQIARREIQLVLKRSGMTRRSLTVNIDPSVLALLVREGYSPHFGARPLKRTVERRILLPVARFIAEGKGGSGSVLNLTARGSRVDVSVVARAPDDDDRRRAPAKPAPAPAGTDEMSAQMKRIEPHCKRIEARQSDLLARTAEPDFHRSETDRMDILDELHKLDEFLSRCARARESVRRSAVGARRRPDRGAVPAVADRRAELASELDHLELVGACDDPDALADAVIVVSLVKAEGDEIDAVEKLARTYLAVASRRRLHGECLAERRDEHADEVFLRISGLGAAMLFRGEAGLHEFKRRDRAKNPRSGREQIHEDASVVRVEVAPARSIPEKTLLRDTDVQASSLSPSPSRIVNGAKWHVRAFHPAALRSVEAWFPGSKNAACSSACELLGALVRAAEANGERAPAAVVRRYQLGIGSRIKDLRTGRSTTRLAQFFRGQVELLPTAGRRDEKDKASRGT